MKRRFAVATNASTVPQDQEFARRLGAEGVAWWHWLGELWLVVDSKERFTAQSLRAMAKEVFAADRLLVLELNDQGDTWAGVGPKGSADKMFGWIRSNWTRTK